MKPQPIKILYTNWKGVTRERLIYMVGIDSEEQWLLHAIDLEDQTIKDFAFKDIKSNQGSISWAGLGWAGLGWAGTGWAGLGWAGLGWEILLTR